MPVVYRRCAGLDIHKDSITATILVLPEKGDREVRTREFRTHRKELQRLAQWLLGSLVECVAMESTGVYWKSVWNVLEDAAIGAGESVSDQEHSDTKDGWRDSVWIADLMEHGLIKPSFVPPPEIRPLWDLTRLRVQVTGERNRVHNRIHKVLEDANIKLATVLSDLLGVSGHGMLKGCIAGRTDSGWLADYARGTLRNKREELELALRGRVTEHRRYLLAELMAELEFLEDRLARLDQQLSTCTQPFSAQVERLCSIPGVDLLTAWTLLAELGVDMRVFSDTGSCRELGGLVSGQSKVPASA